MEMEKPMEEMKTIYQVGGKLCKDFIGQISYTVCLDQTYEELDIEFSFGPQHFCPANGGLHPAGCHGAGPFH